MNTTIKQVSSFDKIRTLSDAKTEISNAKLLKGESFSFQQIFFCDKQAEVSVSIESALKDNIKIYVVKDSVMDFPCYPKIEGENYPENDDDYITKEPGLMPDILMPIEEQNNFIKTFKDFVTLWFEVNIPDNFTPGQTDIHVCYKGRTLSIPGQEISVSKKLTVDIIDAQLPSQEILFTQWFHTDCIANVHGVSIYSEKHWELIDKYMQLASELGINMILTPVITPSIDIKIGSFRPNIQLVKINKEAELYYFDFSLLKKFIALAKKNGINYFEISHLFSQWGLEYSPNIYVSENGTENLLFGWHISAQDPSYKAFLQQFIPALIDFFTKEEIIENCYFHISDEPALEHLEAYRYAYNLLKPMLKNTKLMDTLSNLDFYDAGLVSIPITPIDHIQPFLEKEIKNQWAYYCCAEGKKVSNRFLSMPTYRNRIIGLQLYKYGIQGFLQWGFNFHYSQLSLYTINPYLTTSAEKAFPSGDPFSVYPGINGPIPSLRAKVFKEALQDISVLKKLESYVGKKNVVKLIEEKAGMEITFDNYPRTAEFQINLMNDIKSLIQEYTK